MADNNSLGLGIITLSSGRKKIRVGTFEAMLPLDSERIPEPPEITDVRTVREHYEQHSRSEHNGQEVRRKAAEEDIILERFDDVSKIVITFGNQVVKREFPYSSGGKNDETLQEQLAILRSEMELLSAKYTSLEKTREDAPPSNLSSMVQRLNELTKETNKCRSEMTALMTREAELVIQNQRLRQERDALRRRAPEPLPERSDDQIKRLTEELAQQSQ